MAAKIYVIISKGRDDKYRYMVDRSQCKDSWWTERFDLAFQYNNEVAANVKASSLKFGDPKVYELTDELIDLLQDGNSDPLDTQDHIFSEEAFNA